MFLRILDITKQVLWVTVGQRAAKLQAVKVGDQKENFFCLDREEPHECLPGLYPGQWNHPQSLKNNNFASLVPTEAHSTFGEI